MCSKESKTGNVRRKKGIEERYLKEGNVSDGEREG
jgi:hypothetical protein